MNLKIALRWKIYLIIFSPIAVGNIAGIVNPQSPVYSYYHILMAFHEDFTLFFLLNAASAILTFFSLLPLFLYVFQIHFLPALIWQWFFILRVIFEIFGHPYELKLLKALFYSNIWYAASFLALSLVLLIPSYIACYRYAFKQNKLFSK